MLDLLGLGSRREREHERRALATVLALLLWMLKGLGATTRVKPFRYFLYPHVNRRHWIRFSEHDILIADSPVIKANPGTSVAYIPRLYQKDIYGYWYPKASVTNLSGMVNNTFISGMVNDSFIWTGITAQFNLTLLLNGQYKLAYELYYWDGANWVMQFDEWAPGIDAYSENFYGVSYSGFFTELNYPDLSSRYYYGMR